MAAKQTQARLTESFAQVKVKWMKNVSKKSAHLRIPSPGSLTMPDNVRIDICLKRLRDYGGVRRKLTNE